MLERTGFRKTRISPLSVKLYRCPFQRQCLSFKMIRVHLRPSAIPLPSPLSPLCPLRPSVQIPPIPSPFFQRGAPPPMLDWSDAL